MLEPIIPWNQIPGYAGNIPKAYSEMVNGATTGAVFVEIGTWLGRSAAAMGQLIKDSGKDIKFYTIDHGLGNQYDDEQRSEVVKLGGCIVSEAVKNLRRAGVNDQVCVITARSENAAHLFSRNSIDFVFIDAGTTSAEINRALMDWWPRVKWKGVIAGNNYVSSRDIYKSVNTFFQQTDSAWPGVDNCWKIEKPDQPKFTYSYSLTPVGIGIITYNRLPLLADCIARVRQLVRRPYRLVVADDCSTDDTVPWCIKNNIKVITGAHRGVAHNKNRAIYALYEAGCDPIILLEDDVQPTTHDWLDVWVLATRYWDHINFARHNGGKFEIYSGTGTPEDPWMCMNISAQCSSVSRRVIKDVGYFDPRFHGYGYGHLEWTWRIGRAGYWGAKQRLALTYGLTEACAPSYYNADEAARNAALMNEIANGTIYRHPWTNDAEKANFLAEQSKVQM